MSHSNRASLLKTLTTLIAQLPKVFPDGSVLVDGKKMATTDIVAHFQRHLVAMDDADAALQRRHQTSAAESADRELSEAAILAVKAYFAAVYGTGSAEYAALGFPTRTRRAPSVPTRATALAKSHATRSARHTMGSRQRAAIHGAATTTPASEPASAATPSSADPTVH